MVSTRNRHVNNNIQSHERTPTVRYLQLLVEIILLFFKITFTICDALFRLIFPIFKKSVKGEVVLVTGAGHGIGKELALQYADLDATVVCLDINEENNKETVLQIKKKGKTGHGYTCDITKQHAVTETIEKVKREVGTITILINNAGILIARSLLEHDENDIKRTFDTNVMSHFWILKSILPSMIKNNYGHIVAVSSGAAYYGCRNLVPYSASKFAVRGIMSSLREEVRCIPNNRIKFTTVFPYIVSTGLITTHVVRFKKLFKEVHPKDAAKSIISAQRRNVIEESIPIHVLVIDIILRQLPIKGKNLLMDFLGFRFESDK